MRTTRWYLCSALALGGTLPSVAACDQWALRVNSDGLLSIQIVSDGGRSQGRFRVRARQADGSRVLDVPASGQLSLADLSPGKVELTLLLPAGCRVSGPNPRSMTLAPNDAVSVAFEVRCGR
jgi:hypothetical protein